MHPLGIFRLQPRNGFEKLGDRWEPLFRLRFDALVDRGFQHRIHLGVQLAKWRRCILTVSHCGQRGLPFFAITLLAGLVAIPRELYEAAQSDGAGPIARFWYITLPLLMPVLAVVILFSTIFTLSDFNIVYVLTRGGPMNMTHLFATYSFALGLQGGQIGQGAAVSLFLFPILLAVVFVQLRLVRKAALYE